MKEEGIKGGSEEVSEGERNKGRERGWGGGGK